MFICKHNCYIKKLSLGWFACKHLQSYHLSVLQFILKSQTFVIDGPSLSHPAIWCKLQVVLKGYVHRHKVIWSSSPSLSAGTSQSLGPRPLVGSSRWTRWRSSGSVGTGRTGAATREDCPPRSASGENGYHPCLASQILSGRKNQNKLLGFKTIFFSWFCFIVFALSPGTHPGASFLSTQSRDRKSPLSPPVWDGHADLTWEAPRSCTCREESPGILWAYLARAVKCIVWSHIPILIDK